MLMLPPHLQHPYKHTNVLPFFTVMLPISLIVKLIMIIVITWFIKGAKVSWNAPTHTFVVTVPLNTPVLSPKAF